MNAREVRIGNWIREAIPNNNPPFQVWGTYSEKGNSKINLFPEAIFEPIPLTEEWLIKFGFNIKESIWFSKKTSIPWTRFEICLKDKRCILFNSQSIKFCDMKFPKSVHCLQNLYYALTGQELEVRS